MASRINSRELGGSLTTDPAKSQASCPCLVFSTLVHSSSNLTTLLCNYSLILLILTNLTVICHLALSYTIDVYEVPLDKTLRV